ncbi:MAG: hypothetical protein WC674_06430 [Candidatus Krumholzibacteriia bacterium]
MKYRKELLPVIFLGSGTALTVCGLAIIVAYGAKAPIAALALLLTGLLDGVTGLIWTVAVLFSRRDETPGGAGGAEARRGGAPAAGPESPERIDEARRSLVLASGLLAVIFLGAVLALLLYLHVIVGCLKSWQLF